MGAQTLLACQRAQDAIREIRHHADHRLHVLVIWIGITVVFFVPRFMPSDPVEVNARAAS